MADDLKVVAEISVKDDFSGPASKALKRVSNDSRKLAADEAKGAKSAHTVADALAQVDRRGQEAARSVNGVTQALAHAAHTPFTTAAAQMRSLQQATDRTRRQMAALLKVANRAGYVVGAGVRMAGDVLTSAGAQIAGGIVTARSVAHVADMDSRYAAFKADANMSREQAAAFKARVQGAAAGAHVREADVMTVAEVMHAVAGNRGFSAASLDIFAKAQKASGSNADDMGALAGLMLRMGIRGPEETGRSISAAMALGDRGGFTLRDFARHGIEAGSVYAAHGRGGAGAMLELATAMQLARDGTGTSAEAAGAVNALIRDLISLSNKGTKARNRIHVFDADGKMRSLLDIQKELVQATGGDMKKLKKLGLGESAQAAVLPMMRAYRETGNFDFLEAYKVTGDEGALERKWRENSDTIESGVTALGNSFDKLMDSLFTEPLKAAARAITGMSEGARDATVALGTLGLGALALFAKVKGARALLEALRKYLGKGGPVGAVENAAKPGAKSHEVLQKAHEQKKNVVKEVKAAPGDAPLKITTPAEGAAAQAVQAASATAARGGWFSRLARGVKGLGWLNFLDAGARVAATELDDDLTRDEKNARHTETAGGLAGAIAGAKLGAAGGGIVAGPYGAPIGAIVGGFLGYFGGSWLGEQLGGRFFGGKGDETAEPPASRQDIEETVMQAPS